VIDDFQRRTASTPGPPDGSGATLAVLRRRFPEETGALGRLESVQAVLARAPAPRTAVHGDFWAGNLLVSGDRVTGVVDWEAGSTCGDPVGDLVRFALSYALYLDRHTRPGARVHGHPGLRAGRWGAGVEYAIAGDGWFPDLFRDFVRRGLARLGIACAGQVGEAERRRLVALLAKAEASSRGRLRGHRRSRWCGRSQVSRHVGSKLGLYRPMPDSDPAHVQIDVSGCNIEARQITLTLGSALRRTNG